MRKKFVPEWQKYPFLGILLPLIAGILFAEYVRPPMVVWAVVLLSGILFIVLTVLVKYSSYRFRFLFGWFLYCFLFFSGITLTLLKSTSIHAGFPRTPCLYTAVLMVNGAEKRHSVQCEAYLLSYSDSLVRTACNDYVVLSFRKSPEAKGLKAGDVIHFYGQTRKPRQDSNPGGFDYAAYLRYQGIGGMAYLPSHAWWKATPAVDELAFKELPFGVRFIVFFRELRNDMLAHFRGQSEDEETVSALSALTLGDVSGLPQQLKDDYSIAGASHILALSGSHLAVLYAILEMLFTVTLYKWRRGRWIGKAAILLIIWNFVFLAGCQPSIIRASIMYTLLVGASLYSRKTLTMNSLVAAAFFMLLADPFSLFDVGFQLSFLAVLGILLFHSPLYLRLRTPWRGVNYVVSVLTVSLSVQVVSFPLVLYYFSSFPLYFLLTNLLVVPVSSLVLLLAVFSFLMQFVAADSFISLWIVKGLYVLVKIQNEGVKWIASLPFSSLYVPGISLLLVVWMYLSISFCVCRKFFTSLHRKYTTLVLVLSGAVCLCFQQAGAMGGERLVFYDNRRCPAAHIITGTRKGLLFPAWKDSLTTGMAYIRSGFWRREGIPEPEVVVPVDYILQWERCNILLLNSPYWLERQLKSRLKMDYVWVCRGFYGRLSGALSSFSVRIVILDSSLSVKYRERYRKECEMLGLPFHDMAENGAYSIGL